MRVPVLPLPCATPAVCILRRAEGRMGKNETESRRLAHPNSAQTAYAGWFNTQLNYEGSRKCADCIIKCFAALRWRVNAGRNPG